MVSQWLRPQPAPASDTYHSLVESIGAVLPAPKAVDNSNCNFGDGSVGKVPAAKPELDYDPGFLGFVVSQF